MANYETNQYFSSEVYKLKNGGMLNPTYGDWRLDTVYSKDNTNKYKGNENINNIHTYDGYAGAIYVNDETKEVLIVNTGTNEKSALDIVNDIQMALGLKPLQYTDAMNIAREALELAQSLGYTVSATGHSLGGSLA